MNSIIKHVREDVILKILRQPESAVSYYTMPSYGTP